jgi:hypothetical protein
MKLITKNIKKLLEKNMSLPEMERKPYLKLFNAYGQGTWLLSEIDENNTFFGLCDLGFGTPELGYVTLEELEAQKVGPLNMIERDMYFLPEYTLSEYAERAYKDGFINA